MNPPITATAYLSAAQRRKIDNNPDARANIVVNNLDRAMEEVVDQILKDDRFVASTAVITVSAAPRGEA